jgi:hypothetical protein
MVSLSGHLHAKKSGTTEVIGFRLFQYNENRRSLFYSNFLLVFFTFILELLSKNEKRAVFFLEYLKNLSECSPKRKIAT